MATSTTVNLHLYLCLFFMQLGTIASNPIRKVINNNCDDQDCEIEIQYQDATRDISLQTSSNDSIEKALLDITIPRDKSSGQNDLVNMIGNLAQMLSSMMQNQQGNHEQLDTIVQQLDIESQPSPTRGLLDYLQTSPELEILTTQQPMIETTHVPMEDCSSAPSTGQYSISPVNGGTNCPFLVVCDMDTRGWIVIQRRFDGSVDFNRNWVDYENGFGSLDGEFWLGLSKMHTITSHGTWKLRFDLEDFDGNRAYAEYGFFQVGDSASNYQLTIRSYSGGNAGDSMISGYDLNGMAFTTKDRDNDERPGSQPNCAIYFGGAWWHKDCAQSNVNGLYNGQGVSRANGMVWYQWKRWAALKKAEMKIQRVD